MTSVYAFPSTDQLSEALNQYVEKLSAEAIKKHGRFTVAVSGGSLPKLLSANLKQNPRIDFNSWHFFFADERCVPLDHEDSNYLELKKQLLDPLAEQIPPGAVHTIKSELSPEEAAEEYMDQLMAVFAAGDAVKFPVFDLILLGMGPDGHTASLFPGHELLSENIEWVSSISDSPKPPKDRITLTFPVLNHAHNVAFVTAGEGKQDMVQKIIEEPEHELPCQRVHPANGTVSWFIDNAAAGKLNPVRLTEFNI